MSMTNEIIDDLRKALQDRNINTAQRGLSQSIKPSRVEFSGDAVSISIMMEDYWKFVNYGVNGTEENHGAPNWGTAPSGEKTFHEAIVDWIPARGLSLPAEFKDFDSFAWAIQTNIKKFGKKGRPFFEDVVNDSLIQKMRIPIENVLGRAIEINITAPWQ